MLPAPRTQEQSDLSITLVLVLLYGIDLTITFLYVERDSQRYLSWIIKMKRKDRVICDNYFRFIPRDTF